MAQRGQETLVTDVLESGGSFIVFKSIHDICTLSRSNQLRDAILQLQNFQKTQEDVVKNAITKDDPEHAFVIQCAGMVWKLEGEKTRAHRFIVDHYSLRFPELAIVIPSDPLVYARLVRAIGNNVDNLLDIVDMMDELVPSQIAVVIIAAACTTAGVPLSAEQLGAVLEAVEQLLFLEKAKQMFLEYIQHRMPLIAPNLCAFLGAALTSQMFTMCDSLTALSRLDPSELIFLGSIRSNDSGVKVHTTGFLSNCDLVSSHPPEMRSKALRLVAPQVITLARIDDNRRAADDSAGLKAREDVRMRMIRWTDPLIHRGAANNTYERLSRRAREKRSRALAAQKEQQRNQQQFEAMREERRSRHHYNKS